LSFLVALTTARKLLQEGMKRCGFEIEPVVGEPSDPRFGDISSPVALELGNTVRGDPGSIAQQIVQKMEMPSGAVFESIRAEGGYINFRLNEAQFSRMVLDEMNAKKSDYGKPAVAHPRRILVEHTNANPNKSLHVGTIRNTVLGDSLQRILRFVGNDVIVLNYIDDSGAQVADNLVAYLNLGYPMEAKGERFDSYAGRVYSEVQPKIEQDEELKRKKSEIIRKIEEGGNDIARFARDFAEKVVVNQLRTCWRIGAFFDLLNWESDVVRSGLLRRAIDMLKDKDRAYVAEDGKNQGALLLKLSDIEDFAHLEQPDEVILRSDQTATYPGKDMAYAWWKVGNPEVDFRYRPFLEQPNGRILWTTDHSRGGNPDRKYAGANLAITLVDVRQEYPQKVVKTALKFLSEKVADSYIPYFYEVVALSGHTAYSLTRQESFLKRQVVHMSGRKGLVVNAEQILDALSQRAREESAKRNPRAREEWLNTVANEIAVASLRYALLKVDLKSLIVFDVEESVKLEGDTGSRLQYTHARAYGILEKAHPFRRVELQARLLSSAPEWDLIRELSKFPYVVQKSVTDLQPKVIAHYARRLADRFNIFYETCPVLAAESDELRSSRLGLVEAFIGVFAAVLDLLGISPLKEM